MNHSNSWLVAVTAGKWQRYGIQEARAAGIKVIAIDADKNAVGFADADRIINLDLRDEKSIINKIKSFGVEISGAVSFASEAGMPLAALIRKEFGLPGIDERLCMHLTDKSSQRKIWAEKNVPGPKFAVCSNEQEVFGAISKIGFPLIIKPSDSSGSRGVIKIESTNDNLKDAIFLAFSNSKSKKLIVEEFMEGIEFTVEVFITDGYVHVLAVTEKKKVNGTRGTVARELATPERPREIISRIEQTVILAFNALDYLDGPGHAEVILKNNGFVGLVEVAGRGGGFMLFDKFIPRVSGVNIARLTALQAVGLPIPKIEINYKAGVLRFFPSRPGIVKNYSGFKEANSIKGVDAGVFVNVGDKTSRATVDGDRLGYILTTAETPMKAQRLANIAENMISFQIE